MTPLTTSPGRRRVVGFGLWCLQGASKQDPGLHEDDASTGPHAAASPGSFACLSGFARCRPDAQGESDPWGCMCSGRRWSGCMASLCPAGNIVPHALARSRSVAWNFDSVEGDSPPGESQRRRAQASRTSGDGKQGLPVIGSGIRNGYVSIEMDEAGEHRRRHRSRRYTSKGPLCS